MTRTWARRTSAALACFTVGVLAVPAGASFLSSRAAAAPAPAGAPEAPRPDERWRITGQGDGRWDVSWTASDALPVGGDRPVITFRDSTLPASVDRDGRTIATTVISPKAPLAEDLDAVLSGDRLDEPGYDLASTSPDRAARGGGTTLGARRSPTPLAADPAAPGPYDVVSSDYQLQPVRVRQLRRPVEMVGHVVEPALGTGPSSRPLVVLVHGRHPFCYRPGASELSWSDRWPCTAPRRELPNHLGYDYLQRRLASQGFATVSIRTNGINAQDETLDGAASAPRSDLVQKHLDHWANIAGEHHVDLSRVVLVGHSRGGEGVDRAATEIAPSAPYRVVGQVLLAPTNIASHAAPYVPTVTVLPSCDGDVSTLEGQRFIDSSRDVLRDDNALRSAVLVTGANHNFFNTEWSPGSAAPSDDDWQGPATAACGSKHPDRLSAAKQRMVGLGLVSAAARLFTGVDDGGLPLLDGSPVTTASFGDADVRSHAVGGGRDVRRPGIDAVATRATGGASSLLCRGERTASTAVAACGRTLDNGITPHWRGESDTVPARDFLELSWARGGAIGGLALTRPLDLRQRRLELRTIVDPRRGPIDVRVRLTDGRGRRVELDPVGGGTISPVRSTEPSLLWAQAVLVQPDAAPGPGVVELGDIRAVELIATSGDGRAWIADVSASDPRDLPDVPARRAPVADLGTVGRVTEGDPPRGRQADTRTVEVPVRLSRASDAPVRLAVNVLAVTARGESSRSMVVDVPAGRTWASVPVTYTRDRRADLPQRSIVSIYPLRNAATGTNTSTVEIVDDDPVPTYRLQPRRRAITEGQTAVFRVVVTGARDYPSYGGLEVRRTRGASPRHPDVKVSDIPTAWVRQHAARAKRRLPLWKAEARMEVEIASSRRVLDLRIPTRRDRAKEHAEWLTVTMSIGGREMTARVQVRDRQRSR